MSISTRALKAINLQQYSELNLPELVGEVVVDYPVVNQAVLRMLIKQPNENFKIPAELTWIEPILKLAINYQKDVVGIEHSFVYLTVRNGYFHAENNDTWHVDGFSTRINHIPEQNYIWSNYSATEYLLQKFDIPKDFDPLYHNLHHYFNYHADHKYLMKSVNSALMCIDPYVIHRRPTYNEKLPRSFVRISFTPIEIMDDSNSQNPLLPVRVYHRRGVEDFRNGLRSYHGNK